ncbi:hypothetical protein ACQBAR_05890 [Propionibacteriaceae bacterium Y1685]|uniref:hypothetical protein n=1 Tax=Microlunatus sp. Y1700 TaxID=3418487 RepID=UPI003B7B28C4
MPERDEAPQRDFIQQHSRWPEPPDDQLPVAPDELADHLLRLACLNYAHDRPEAPVRARQLIAEHPELATATVFTMAASGADAELAALLAEQPALANSSGGPFDWPLLLYLTYGRLGDAPGRSAVRTAEVLLAVGADPDAGFCGRGRCPPSPP